MQYFWQFASELHHKFETKEEVTVTTSIKNNLSRIASKIQQIDRKTGQTGGEYRITDMIRATIVV